MTSKNTLLTNQCIKREIKKYPETKENENITYQNLWNAAKLVLKGKFTVIKSFYKKPENLTESKLPSKRIRKKKKDGNNKDQRGDN